MGLGHLRSYSRRSRVVYAKNPLVEVVAAVQFPDVLALIQEPPSEFQKRFSKDYPLSEIRQLIAALAVGPSEPQKPITQPGRTYFFSSLDKNWTVSVESKLLALTCRNYREWPEFRKRFKPLLEAMIEMYGIGVISRLGLRYQDVIVRKALGLEGHSWNELLQPEVLRSFAFFTDEIEQSPPMSASIELGIPPGKIKIALSTVISQETKDEGLLIDTDCFAEKNIPADVDEILKQADDLHTYTGLVFDACISDTLHQALK